MREYIPVLILAVLSTVNAVMMVGMSHTMGPNRPTPAKRAPYESGITPIEEARQLLEMPLFIGVLALGLAYAWKRGALEWD